MAPRLRLSPPKKERRSLLFEEPKRTRSSLLGPIVFLAALSLGVMCVVTQKSPSGGATNSWMMLEQWTMESTTSRQLSPSTSYKTAPVISKETEPGIVWLMSFPNRYVGSRGVHHPISCLFSRTSYCIPLTLSIHPSIHPTVAHPLRFT